MNHIAIKKTCTIGPNTNTTKAIITITSIMEIDQDDLSRESFDSALEALPYLDWDGDNKNLFEEAIQYLSWAQGVHGWSVLISEDWETITGSKAENVQKYEHKFNPFDGTWASSEDAKKEMTDAEWME